MKNLDFLNEIHSYIDKTFKDFEKYQNIVQDILIEFDRICELNNIPYWLGYGNLLGAVRDQSQLPWDYDVDVVTPITYRNRLIEALEKQLQNKYSYAYITNVKNYPTFCLRVYNKDYTWMALHVDVFFLIGAPSEKDKQDAFFKEGTKLKRLRTFKNLHFHLKSSNKKQQFLENFYYNIRYLFTPRWRMQQKEEAFISRYPIEKASYYMTFGGVQNAFFPKEIFKTIQVEINGKKYPIPSGYNEFLKRVYGDWQSYLPIQNRFEEFYKMKNIVDKRQRDYKANLKN